MRSILQTALITFALVLSTLAAPEPDSKLQPQPVEDVLGIQTAAAEPVDAGAAAGATNSEAILEAPTTFNGIEVPPMKELDGEKFDEDIKDGYWFLKHYSPFCAHCISIAPTWQTLYEFYYTSEPLASSSQSSDTQTSMNSFQRYYNFRFASLDCIAFGDICIKQDVKAFPTFSLYKNGQFVKKFEGTRDMAGLSHFIEETLETIRPGSRPKDGVKLPEPGASSVEAGAQPDVPLEKDKSPAAGAAAAMKQNEKVAATSAEVTATKASLQATKGAEKTTKPKAVPNPLGTSVPLSAESFQKLVTTSQDPWFIKFYVPWCHHCQALAPNWLQMSKELQGNLNVGEVNCEIEPRLCKDVRVKGYPTIHFFRGGERVEYDGLRGLGDLVSYAKKALDIGSGVRYVDAATFKEMEETEEVIFVYLYDHATTSEDFEALERLTLSLIGHARIVKSDSALLAERFKISTWPRLLVSRDGRPSYYNALAPKDMRDFRQVLNWMQSVWLPIVPELTASNSREIMDGRYVVLGILNRDRQEGFIQDKREIKNAALEWMDKQTHAFQLERQEMRDAKQLRIEEAEDRNDQRALRAAKSIRIQISEDDKKQVGFAWVDGIFWQRWIRTTYGIDVREGERVIINDEDNRRYWDMTDAGGYIVPSRTSILETIPRVIASPPKLKPKSTTGALENAFFHLSAGMTSHPWLTLALLVGFVVGSATYGRNRIRKVRGAWGSGGGFFQVGDGEKGLLNGGGAGGKVD
ncbi:MAG: disulfide isomerase [Lasallia pustulata]|uniref:Disulfide isomerase n=1 Tax=Lasallia pustulata TaxID=136370 RepID=A0A1W5D338_9LECA|nr:MAG: disulfide isomerase [Lasallia pustulata]SLM37543.1 protein disulfide-isomerase [Lasallia pustulata]